MAPKYTDKVLEGELKNAVRRIYNSPEKEQLTVNYARQVAEKKLKLENGFFKEGDWKAKSKQVIHDALTEAESAAAEGSLQDTAPLEPKLAVQPKPSPKPNKAEIVKKKRARREPTPEEVESDLSDLSDISDIPKKSAKKRKLASGTHKKTKKRVISDDEDSDGDDDDDDESFASSGEAEVQPKKSKSVAPKAESKPPKAAPKASVEDKDSGLDSPLSELESEGDNVPVKAEGSKPSKARRARTDESELPDPKESPKRKHKPKKSKTESPPTPASDDDASEMSVVFDEPPKRKRKSGGAPAKGERKSKAPAKAATKAAPADLSPDDALIKQLQGQLLKCGLRKIWGFELKKYGDDKKAKIRHLKDMLTEVGMVGRFSDARAREIKERRELEADLNAVMEGEKHWGLTKGRPARRRLVKSFKESTEEEDGDQGGEKQAGSDVESDFSKGGNDHDKDDDDDSEEENTQAKARGRVSARPRASLAFLGDDSESE